MTENNNFGKYILQKLLGSGASAQVFLSTDKDGKQVAIKVMNPRLILDQVPFIKKEFTVGKNIHKICKFTPDYIELINGRVPDSTLFPEAWRNKPSMAMVIEYISGFSLKEYLNTPNVPINDLVILDALVRIGEVIKCIHDNGYAHGDLNLGNIIVNDEYYVIDFGGSCGLPGSLSQILKPSDICDMSNMIAAPAFALPAAFIPTIKDKNYWIKHELSAEKTQEYYSANDVYSLVICGFNLINPTLAGKDQTLLQILVYKPRQVEELVQNYLKRNSIADTNKKLAKLLVKYYRIFHQRESTRTTPFPTINQFLADIKNIFAEYRDAVGGARRPSSPQAKQVNFPVNPGSSVLTSSPENYPIYPPGSILPSSSTQLIPPSSPRYPKMNPVSPIYPESLSLPPSIAQVSSSMTSTNSPLYPPGLILPPSINQDRRGYQGTTSTSQTRSRIPLEPKIGSSPSRAFSGSSTETNIGSNLEASDSTSTLYSLSS